MPKKQGKKVGESAKKEHTSASSKQAPLVHKLLLPTRIGSRLAGFDVPLTQIHQVEKDAYFARVASKGAARAQYEHNWGDCLVDQALPDNPGPIVSGTFKPVTRWCVIYRTPEAGQDGTHVITVNDVRVAIGGQGTTVSAPFIIKQLHVWLAPNVANTHFSGIIITKDDAENGILGGQYSDIAPLTEFCKFRIRYPGEGQVKGSTTAGTQEVLGLGGSAKWNGVVYALIETYD